MVSSETIEIEVVGGGLAGCEAAYRASKSSCVHITLHEMRPHRMTPAHKTGGLAELVCSNSLKSDRIQNAHGLLKAELRLLDSLIMRAADASKVPAGSALAVDRALFSEIVTRTIESLPNVALRREEVRSIPSAGIVIIATGPLSSPTISREIEKLIGRRSLFFFDAIAPIVSGESIDPSKVFRASRYGRGEDDYINCPMTEAEYREFRRALLEAEVVPLRDFEDGALFEGCLPIEELARRGEETMRFGPLKPVGLVDPRTGEMPHAVVQLRRENFVGSAYNIVGFQTRLKYGEQKRVFRMIPGLEGAEFLRFGSMHRNTFIDSPRILLPTLQYRGDPRIFFAGQITGVEGYVESAAMGLLAGLNASRLAEGKDAVVPPPTTMMGALVRYITQPHEDFQPMNANFGILPSLEKKVPRGRRATSRAGRALRDLGKWIENLDRHQA
ncbi:MAG: methylenetetrahydrofolate--tRNA-(uracil(54)-C(5))-methyltransferase (FADH(2)-oxidizing) TrmFO [bacterium]